jgi:CRISPR system Cascade subunit CasE
MEVARTVLPDWLARQGLRDGFEPVADALMVEAYEGARFFSRARRPVQISGVDLRGELTVTDPDAFRRMLFQGLGSAKGFGYGLMLVRRAMA